jgi:hypothetical protein
LDAEPEQAEELELFRVTALTGFTVLAFLFQN